MNKKTRSTRRSLLTVGLAVFVFVFALVYAPAFFSSKATGRKVEQKKAVGNYDIRTDTKAGDKMANFRARSNRSASAVADMRDAFVQGEKDLRGRIPSLKVEYSDRLQIPEVIGVESGKQKASLMAQSSAKRSDVLRSFAKENASFVGISNSQADVLKEAADYTNPDANLSFAVLEQEIDGIPVFQGEIKAGFNKRGEMFRVINNVAPDLDYESLSREFGDPTAAVRAAATSINVDPASIDMTPGAIKSEAARSRSDTVLFGTGDQPTSAEKMYFPTEPGVAVPAWRVLIWQPRDAFYVIVDAETGTVLWRKNITNDQTQSATYRVYTNSNAMINVAHSPFPFSPGPLSPDGTQGQALTRTLVTRIGNEAPYTFNNLGWITDGNNQTDGNNVEAGLDRDATDGVDTSNGRVTGTNRTFDFAFSPSDPNTNTGDTPTPVGEPITSLPNDKTPGVCNEITQPHGMVDAQRAAITQLFYISNAYHDELYRLGFTEAAGNFQNVNFTGQGLGSDRVSAEAQDCSGTNNANFGTPADGQRPRMQMYLFTGPTPDIDGSLDADVVVHEYTHGLSNRLHGNASGLLNDMANGMGEGWSDFYGMSVLSQPSDPTNGIYTTGAYASYRINGTFANNAYYGIRRFPTAVKTFTGGPNNRPHNPLTFADIDQSKLSTSDGAFSPAFTGTADEVHNAGEVWCVTLWEVRSRFIGRLGWAAGNRQALQFVMDGMKLAPINPTFLSERNAIIAATRASGTSQDVADVWSGFATRGMGFSAAIQNVGGTSLGGTGTTRVTEAFDLPNLQQISNVTLSDPEGNNNGFPEPGEKIVLSVPLTNIGGQTATGVTGQIVGGGSANYGSIADNQTTTQGLSYTIPVATPCGSVIDITINVNSNLGPTSFVRSIIVGVPNQTFGQNFDGVAAPNLPAGWTSISVLNGLNFVTTTSFNDTAPNSIFAADPANNAAQADLTSPSIAISAQAATLSFRHRFDTEAAWDGGVLEISIAGGAYSDILSAGGVFISNGYNGTMTAAAPATGYTPNPLNGRNGWTGNSGGFITTTVRLPAAAAGQNVQLKWRMGADSNTNSGNVGSGWYIDTVKVNGSYNCTVFSNHTKAPFDFDGDNKTDFTVFRPEGGAWWELRSSDFTHPVGLQFGLSTDVLVPGDYTGDGKADVAVYRPSTGEWFILRSEDGSFYGYQWGTAGDIPAPADYDGDGRMDTAVYRPSEGAWYILQSSTFTPSYAYFGIAGDQPVPADYDGDGKADPAIVRNMGDGNKQWWVEGSSAGVSGVNFGITTDKTVPGDYTGDGKVDIAVFRPSTGVWYILRSEEPSYFGFNWGQAGDIPAPGDYDGDGKMDAAVYRPSDSVFYVLRSDAQGYMFVPWGLSTDVPVPSVYTK